MTHKHEVAPLGCHLWVPRCWICCIVLRAIAPVSGSQVSLHPSGSISEHSRYIYQNAQIFTLSIVLIFIWLNSNLHKNRGFTRLINYPLTRNSLDYRLTQLINLTSKHPQQHTTNTIITYLIQISHNSQSSKINSGWKFRDVTKLEVGIFTQCKSCVNMGAHTAWDLCGQKNFHTIWILCGSGGFTQRETCVAISISTQRESCVGSRWIHTAWVLCEYWSANGTR